MTSSLFKERNRPIESESILIIKKSLFSLLKIYAKESTLVQLKNKNPDILKITFLNRESNNRISTIELELLSDRINILDIEINPNRTGWGTIVIKEIIRIAKELKLKKVYGKNVIGKHSGRLLGGLGFVQEENDLYVLNLD